MDAVPALRTRLAAWNPDEASVAFDFTGRLARDNDWTRDFAARVVEEYRRFIELYVTAGHPVTPSDEVDQAWHLHLLYTREYWDHFCPEVTGVPIHHGPTRGGHVDQGRFVDAYAKTRASYERVFGEAPPADIWPEGPRRFRRGRSMVRVSKDEHWLLPKRRVLRVGRAVAVTVGALTLLGGCAGIVIAGELGWVGWVLAVVLVAIVLNGIKRSMRRRKEIRLLELEIEDEADPKKRAILEARLIRLKKPGKGGGDGGSGGFFGWGGCGGCSGCSGCGGCGGCGG